MRFVGTNRLILGADVLSIYIEREKNFGAVFNPYS